MKTIKNIVVLIILTSKILYAAQQNSIIEIKNGWIKTSKTKGWKKITFPVNLKKLGIKDKIIWEKIKIPPIPKDEKYAIYIDEIDEIYEIYLNNKLIKKHGDIEKRIFKGKPFVLIPLTHKDSNKELKIKAYSNRKIRIGILSIPLFGPIEEIVKWVFLKDIFRFATGVFSILIGIGALIFWLANRKEYFLSFSVVSIVMGVFIIAQIDMRRYIYNAPLIWSYIDVTSLHLIAPAFSWFLYSIYKDENKMKRIFLILLLINTIYSLTMLLFIYTKLIPIFNTIIITVRVILLDMIIVGLLSIYYAFKKRTDAIIFLGGLSLLILTGVIDILTSLGVFPQPIPIKVHLGLLGFLASLIGIIVYKDKKKYEELISIQKELNIAKKIQLETLPNYIIKTPNFKKEILYIPSREVGGDFYDFWIKDNEKISVFLADVSGHGIPAALVSSMLKIAILSIKKQDFTPSQILKMMNSFIIEATNTLVTALSIEVNPKDTTVLYSRAGHIPMIIQKDDKIYEIPSKGPILGFIEKPKIELKRIIFPDHIRIFLYTDGIIEARNPVTKEMFGMERFYDFLLTNRNLSLQKLKEKLYEELKKWSENFFEDDITFISMEIKK